MRSFLAALAFLTIVPVHLRSAPPAETVARSRFWFPVVSLILGTVLGLWSALVLRLPAPGLAAFLILHRMSAGIGADLVVSQQDVSIGRQGHVASR